MIEIEFSATFIRLVQRMDKDMREEVYEKVDLLKNADYHTRLKVHKLHGKLKRFYGFSVNYQLRIVFEKITSRRYLLHIIGGHEIYE